MNKYKIDQKYRVNDNDCYLSHYGTVTIHAIDKIHTSYFKQNIKKQIIMVKSKKMKKLIKIKGKLYPLIRYNDEWVFPLITTYFSDIGAPIALILYSLNGTRLEYYTDITRNIPSANRNVRCQVIDTNNIGHEILVWLEENKFGKQTRHSVDSGFCTYPIFNFYEGERYWEYRKYSQEINYEL